MGHIKKRWDIVKNWQYLFPFLGFLTVVFSAYLLARVSLSPFNTNSNTIVYWLALSIVSIAFFYMILKITLWLFEKLKNKWIVTYRWEMIAIFIVFAITGSLSAKLAAPLLDILSLTTENTNIILYWFLRIFIILPIYQLLLVGIGWLFGQFRFFWNFEKKMLNRMGIKIK